MLFKIQFTEYVVVRKTFAGARFQVSAFPSILGRVLGLIICLESF